MKNKNLTLGILLVALAVIAYFIVYSNSGKVTTEKDKLLDSPFFKVDSATIDKLEIERNGKKIVLSKIGIEWKVTEPVDYKATQPFIASAIGDLKKYKLASRESDNPEFKDRFGFNDTNVAKITVYQAGNPAGTFEMGNATSGPSQTYVRKPGDKIIYRADGLLRMNFVKDDLQEWRDKSIISIPKGAVKSIEFFGPGGENHKIVKDSASGTYFLGKDTANATIADGLMNLLQNFNTQYFYDKPLNKDLKPNYNVKVVWNNITTEFTFYKVGTEESNPKHVLKVTGINQLFDVDENYVKMLYKTKKELSKAG